ncbi:PREDICTED: probable acyl-activating enzyme [Prunus dulcis]|uniref:PREDICTED: probable acyl-activating enzyme n=1 Tax=Prunus dulcis TaxID=3755 RepID=A0A5E4ECV7_PRUDU|nr:PREDICTED: probable acyl-activating enzyme [Prunus dulcis]
MESVLYWNPVVNEAAVVAKQDKFGGSTPCAFVCLESAGLDCSVPSEKDIMEFCRKRLPHFLAPKTVVFTEELPKTSTVQKFVLREIAVSMG